MTHAMSSTVAPRVALISLIATFTIEVSINSITAAEITVMTMIHFRNPCSATSSPLFAGGYRDIDAHARAQWRLCVITAIDEKLYRHALRHFDEISGSIVGRQQRELRACSRRNRLDRAMK